MKYLKLGAALAVSLLLWVPGFCLAAQPRPAVAPLSTQRAGGSASRPSAGMTIAARTAGLERRDGLFPLYWDAARGEMLFELSPATLSRKFILASGLDSGVGTITMFADRGSLARAGICRLRRIGPRVLVIEENSRFRATAPGDEALKFSVKRSFPESVLAALPIEAEENGTLIVNATPLLVRDSFGLLRQLQFPLRAVNGVIRPGAGTGASWRLDETRSAVDPDSAKAFPLNDELDAVLTFIAGGPGLGQWPQPGVLTVREHESLVALPDDGFHPREADPRVGYFGERFLDFSQPFDKALQRMLIERWRLQKKDPAAPVSDPVKPLVYYLDSAIPAEVRPAVRRGVLWWNQAFEAAGFSNAIEVRDLPPGADPLDLRYTTIQWTNRSGRGWSVGQAQSDPRTGEILHALVQLDSWRVRTMHNYWDALEPMPSGQSSDDEGLGAFALLDGLDPRTSERQVTLNRIALLACHEVGHTLGLEHNFLASTFGRGSVMDYYAPRVKIRPDGTADLSDAYMQGVGRYDIFAIRWGYSESPGDGNPEQERDRLDGIVRDSIAHGIVWGSPADPRWNAYDDGPDPVTWLRETMPVRDALLAHYGQDTLRPGQPLWDLNSRFALVYLFHRYALAAALNTIGSAKIPLSLEGDGQQPVQVWPAASQREALKLELAALAPRELAIPPALWRQLAPPDGRDPEAFASSAGYLFSPNDAARAVAEIVVQGLLDPERLERIETIAAETAPNGSGQATANRALTGDELIGTLIQATIAQPQNDVASAELHDAVADEVIRRLMTLAVDPQAPPEVQALGWRGLDLGEAAIRAQLSNRAEAPGMSRLLGEIGVFRRDPHHNVPTIKPAGAPPGPPV
jgi:hypothetical protein